MKKVCVILIAIMILSIPISSLANNEDIGITRAEFVKELLIQANIDIEKVSETSLNDVIDAEYIPYVATAYKNGYILGDYKELELNESITKEQAVIMIVRVFGEKTGLKNISQEVINRKLDFSDNVSISPWAKTYITYALDKGLIKKDNSAFYPQMLLNENQANILISYAKNVYKRIFMRNGLSASDMLILSNEKNAENETYKQKGVMEMGIKMNIDGIPQEEMENNQDIANFMNEGTSMIIDIDTQVQNPDKAYVKEIIKSSEIEESIVQEIEIFMDGSTMYTKMVGSNKWIKQDISSLMNQIQSLSNNNEPYKMSQLSDEELKFYKNYAIFEDDTQINNKEYYVISIAIDKDTFKEYYMEIIGKTLDSIVELQTNNLQLQEDIDFDEEEYRQMMMQIINQMEVEINYEFYINKDTNTYDKMSIVEDLYMDIDNSVLMTEEENTDMSLEMITHIEGEFDFYDFNKEINFPIIEAEDIMDTTELM